MSNRIVAIFASTGALVFAGCSALAPDAGDPQQENRMQNQEQVYGSQLMTRQERIEHRTKMRAAKTAAEREQIRNEHHERMKERARERGVALPEAPPVGGVGTPGGRFP